MTARPNWVFLTSHAAVLVNVERAPDATVSELSERVGITERQVHRVLVDLEAGGYVTRRRVGRRNHYAVNRRRPMRHPNLAEQEIGLLLAALSPQA